MRLTFEMTERCFLAAVKFMLSVVGAGVAAKALWSLCVILPLF